MNISFERLGRGELDHELVWSSVALVSLAGAFAYSRLAHPPALACTFRSLTGWPCVTCGATRAVLALLHGGIGDAFRWNPLVAAGALALVPYLLYALTVVAFDLPRLTVRLDTRDWKRLRAATIVSVVTTWVFLLVDGR